MLVDTKVMCISDKTKNPILAVRNCNLHAPQITLFAYLVNCRPILQGDKSNERKSAHKLLHFLYKQLVNCGLYWN